MSTNVSIDPIHRNLVDSLLVPHAAFERAVARIDQCFDAMALASDPVCIAVVGESRTGKSRCLEHFERSHPPVRTEAGLSVPFLRAKVPARPTVKGLVTLLLHALRDPMFDKGTEITKTLRLQTLIKQVGTVVLALDEFQHFQDKATHKIQHEVADWLKVLVDETKIGLVVTGLPSCMAVIRQNEQLAGRFMAPVIMRRFDWREDEDRLDFRGILGAMQAALTPFKFPDLASNEMAFRFYCATGGLIGYVIKLLKQATWNSLDAVTHAIGLDALAKAYKESVVTEELEMLQQPNPFDRDFTELSEETATSHARTIGQSVAPPVKPRKIRNRKSPEADVGQVLKS